MRILITVRIISLICLISLLSAQAEAITLKKDIRLAKGEFEIPAEIKKETKVTGLQPFLDSESEFTRMAAVRRLAEIEGPKAVSLLRLIFTKEPAAWGLHDIPHVKFEVIRRLGIIDTEQAKSALLDILKGYWQKGPNVNNKKSYRFDRDFTTVMPLLLETLYRWSGDEDVFKTVEEIALSQDVKNFYTKRNGIGQRAWEVYLKGKIIREGVDEGAQSAIYILEFVGKLRKQSSYSKFEYIQSHAAFEILQKHDKTVLSSLVEKFEKELGKNEQAIERDSERNYHIRCIISYIEAALQEKAKREASQTQ